MAISTHVREKHKELASYIDLLNKKRAKRRSKRNVKRNLRIDAILREALDSAMVRLRHRQIQDIEEWQRQQAIEAERAREEQRRQYEAHYDPFSDPGLSDELGSLNSFMKSLSSCKVISAQC